LLPASCKVICVDFNPASVTKLTDRGSTQTIGLVMDAASFLRELSEALAHLGPAAASGSGQEAARAEVAASKVV
jgi:hypothetical protein